MGPTRTPARPVRAPSRPAPPSSRAPGSRRPGGRTSGSTRAATSLSSPRPRPRLTGRAVVLGLVIVVLAVSYASSLRAWSEQRSELETLRSQIAERRAAVAALEAEVVRWKDPAYVEAQARSRFGWVMPGEVGYRVLGANGQPLGGIGLTAVPAGAGEPPARDWWEGLWGSVQAAGQEAGERRTRAPGRTPATRIGPDRGRGSMPTRPAMGQPL